MYCDGGKPYGAYVRRGKTLMEVLPTVEEELRPYWTVFV